MGPWYSRLFVGEGVGESWIPEAETHRLRITGNGLAGFTWGRSNMSD